MDRRAKMLDGLDVAKLHGVEIGPLAWPLVRKTDGDVIYVDFTDAESLREKYRPQGNVPVHEIVDVDAIWGANTLQQAIGEDRKADYVIASHVIEHVPDLLAWLSELRAVLKPGGEIRLAVPDKRFTFDYLRRETEAADVLAANIAGARVPQPQRVLDFVLNYVDVDKVAAWKGEIAADSLVRKNSIQEAMNKAQQSASGEYVDVHCWVFTPRSMGALFARLAKDGLIDLECIQFYDTAPGEYEFFIALRPIDDQERVIESWQHLHDSAVEQPDPKQVEIDALRASLALAVGERDALQERVSLMQASHSWSITSPLRAISRNLRNR